MHIPRFSVLLAVSMSLFFVQPTTAQDDGWRTIEFTTTEVTSPDVTVSPDGEWLIFTMLGHLFQLPVEGGTAEQLTFGPYYDTDPVFSPDGNSIAFVSDRDGSDGNVFVVELASGQITQVTHEPWVARPIWTPDGQAIVYLRLLPDVPGVVPTPNYSVPETVPALVRRTTLSGEEPETLTAAPQVIGSVFYLPDGRLAWTVVELSVELDGTWWKGSVRASTRIEVVGAQGTVSTLRTLAGYAAPAIASPTGDGIYYRRYYPLLPWHRRSPEDLVFLPLPGGFEKRVVPLARPRGWVPRFAVAADNTSLYLGAAGRLWKIVLPNGAREHIPFRARVRLEILDPVPPPNPLLAEAGSSAPPRSILHPRFSPDGRTVVFMAARYLWKQSMVGGGAQRLFEGNAIEGDPAFSPDGDRLAFTHRQHGKQELRVFDVRTGEVHTVASGAPGGWQLTWSPDGRRLLFVAGNRVVAVEVGTGEQEELPVPDGWSPGRPHLSLDGASLYFSDNGTFYRLPLQEALKPEPVTQLSRDLWNARLSPDEEWLAFGRGTEIWIAPFGKGPVTEEDVRQLSAEGAEGFAFSPDGSALIYSVGNRVWRHPLAGARRHNIPIHMELTRPIPPPLLIRRVRVLDFASGGFGPESSLLVEAGRVSWIGSEGGRRVPRDIITIDAGGRFAIPGLFDLHVHRTWAQPAALVAYGITSARDLGSGLSYMSALADRSEATSLPLPRFFFSGEVFGDWLIRDRDDARSLVRQWKERSAQFIKVYPPIPWSLQRTVVEEARRLGLPVIGHGTDVEEITKSVTLGYLTLEHTPSPPPYDDVLQMLAAAGTRWVPTLAMYGGNALLLRDEPERLADVKLRAFAPAQDILGAQMGSLWWALGDQALRGQWEEELAAVRAGHRLGVKLQVGSDAGPYGVGVLLGPSLHWELEYFVEAGLSPLEVLRIATQEAAAAVGAEEDLGTLEVGKLADIVLLDANPLEDIKNTQTIWRVIKGGWVFDPEELQAAARNRSN